MTSFDSVAANDPVAAEQMAAAGRVPHYLNANAGRRRVASSRLYEEGDRVRLIFTDDPWTKLRVGTKGTVGFVDDAGTIHVQWDDGSRLGMCLEDGDVIARISMCIGGREITECSCADEDGHVDECDFERGQV